MTDNDLVIAWRAALAAVPPLSSSRIPSSIEWAEHKAKMAALFAIDDEIMKRARLTAGQKPSAP